LRNSVLHYRYPIMLALVLTLFGMAGFGTGQDSVQLAEILQKAGERVQGYSEAVLSVVCKETSRRQELESDLKTTRKATERTYDLTIVHPQGRSIVERRELKSIDGKAAKTGEPPDRSDPPAYLASLLVLLPQSQSQYAFSFAGTGDLDGRESFILDYVPATRIPPNVTWKDGQFMVRSQSKGRIWIDPGTYDVLRIDTHLIESFEFKSPPITKRKGPFVAFGPGHRFKLERSDFSIRFGPTHFQEPEQTLLLPASVEILSVFEGSRVPRLRTTHSFTDYKRFTSDIMIVQ
jgi:hypothetical protein